jgi:hypothetical protein
MCGSEMRMAFMTHRVPPLPEEEGYWYPDWRSLGGVAGRDDSGADRPSRSAWFGIHRSTRGKVRCDACGPRSQDLAVVATVFTHIRRCGRDVSRVSVPNPCSGLGMVRMAPRCLGRNSRPYFPMVGPQALPTLCHSRTFEQRGAGIWRDSVAHRCRYVRLVARYRSYLFGDVVG